MKKTKLRIRNQSNGVLRVSCKNCGRNIIDQWEVKKRIKIKLDPGRYTICLYYDQANVELTSNINDLLQVDDIPSPENRVYIGKMIVVNYFEKSINIECKEKFSVAAFLGQK